MYTDFWKLFPCYRMLSASVQRFRLQRALVLLVATQMIGEWTVYHHYIHFKRLRWSRGSVLAFGTQVRRFKPTRSLWIFQGEKILSTPSFGREVKPFVPCRWFTACKRSMNVAWKSGIFRHRPFLAQVFLPFTTRVSGGDTWWYK